MFYSWFCSVSPEKLGAVLDILCMPTILSSMENARECLKDLYIIIIHLFRNCIIFCSIICEMDLANASNFLRSRINLTPPVPARLWNTWSKSHLECPHMIRAKWCLGTIVPGAAPIEIFFYNRKTVKQSFRPRLLKRALFRKKDFSLPCKTNAPFKFQSKGSCWLPPIQNGHSESNLSLTPSHLYCYGEVRVSSHGSFICPFFLGNKGNWKDSSFLSDGAELKGFSNLFINRCIAICSSETQHIEWKFKEDMMDIDEEF